MNKSIWLPLILLLLLILAFLFWLCPKCFFGAGIAAAGGEDEKTEVIKETVKTAAVTALAPVGLAISDGAAFGTKAATNIDFNRSSFSHIAPLSGEVNTSLKETAEYLKAHPDRGLTINGIYGGNEKNTSAYGNLGLARANNVKGILSKLGVPAAQLGITASLIGTGITWKDVMYNGVNFKIGKANDSSGRLADIKARLLGKPITLYFPTGKQEVNLSSQQRKDFGDLVFYLDNVAASSLEVSGHTDNKGGSAGNKRLSRKRAEFVRDYLVGNGLGKKRLSATGFGPDKPIATNDTDDGRSKNRRVEVTLK